MTMNLIIYNISVSVLRSEDEMPRSNNKNNSDQFELRNEINQAARGAND